MILDWKNQYCENDYTTQSNLQIQCNPYQITNGIFYGTRTNQLKICMETQKIPNSQSSLFFFIYIYIYFIFGCVGSSLLSVGFLQLCERGLLFIAVLRLLIVVASLAVKHRLQVRSLQQLWLTGSRVQAQQLWRMGLVAPQHVGFSQTRAQTLVPCEPKQS